MSTRSELKRIRREILVGRGVGRDEYLTTFTTPDITGMRDPAGIPDLVGLAQGIVDAVSSDAAIALYGDYDADGISSVAVLYRFLRSCGVTPRTALASRTQGYGFRAVAVINADLVIVCDCGTTDEAEVAAAIAVGSRVGIIDHHGVPRDPTSHPATWLVNPKRTDSRYGFDGLCSASLAWVVCSVAAEMLGRPAPTDLLPYAAVAQIADVASMRWEGRVITTLGMGAVVPPGIAALLDRGGERALTPKTAGWVVGPRLNAPGRMGDPTPALAVLIEDSPIGISSAADCVEEENAARKLASDLAVADARLTCRLLGSAVYASGDWPTGVSGIVAGRLATEFSRPTFVAALAADGSATGSARSGGGASVYDALAACSSSLARWGGHRAAAGFRFGPGGEDAFVAALAAWQPSPDDGGDVGPDPIDLGAIALRDAYQIVAGLEPYGTDFPEPTFRVVGVVEATRWIGRGHEHLEIRLDGNRRVVAWRAVGRIDVSAIGERVVVVGRIRTGVWQGKRTFEIDADSVVSA